MYLCRMYLFHPVGNLNCVTIVNALEYSAVWLSRVVIGGGKSDWFDVRILNSCHNF